MMKLFGDFEKMGIVVYVEDGKVIVADAQEVNEFGEDTEENRELAIAEAKETVAAWESEK